jgi:KaiC/GvpD/RAD55 family RecA-like ATPase
VSHQIRVVIPHPDSHVKALAGLVASLQKQGRRVLLVTADRPLRTLQAAFAAESIDVEQVHFLDCVSAMDGQAPAERPPNATFMASPTMLEMMAMRIEQLAQRLGADAYVVVDSLSTLAIYNGIPPVQEFSHYLANRLRTRSVPGDFIIMDNQDGRALQEKVAGFVDARHVLGRPA